MRFNVQRARKLARDAGMETLTLKIHFVKWWEVNRERSTVYTQEDVALRAYLGACFANGPEAVVLKHPTFKAS